MKNHTTSLELPKELKAKGFPQETEFYWIIDEEAKINRLHPANDPIPEYEEDQEYGSIFPTPLDILTNETWADWKEQAEVYSAPIATEIELPIVISQNGEDHNLNIYRPSQFLKGVDLSLGYQVGYENGVFSHDNIDIQSAPTLQEAMAKMWLYLKDNGLI